MRRKTLPIAVLIAAMLVVNGSSEPQSQWPIAQAPAELRSSIARADIVVAAMHDAVLQELSRTLAQGGPELAINSCHLDATVITRRTGRNEGVAAGRTSDRLRAPTNRPPAWAAPLVTEFAGYRARDVDGFVVDLGENVGVLRPIVERPICANCHGPVERISPGVRQVLLERYPADRALGFADGEIRGWYWVEVPRARR